MLKIKPDQTLRDISSELKVSPEDLIATLMLVTGIADDECDGYAGERLGELFMDQPERKAWLSYHYPANTNMFDDLILLYEGAESPCPLCGWDMTPEEEGQFIVGYKCPHCGHSQLELPEDE